MSLIRTLPNGKQFIRNKRIRFTIEDKLPPVIVLKDTSEPFLFDGCDVDAAMMVLNIKDLFTSYSDNYTAKGALRYQVKVVSLTGDLLSDWSNISDIENYAIPVNVKSYKVLLRVMDNNNNYSDMTLGKVKIFNTPQFLNVKIG
ncbi:hypothetical protein K4L44_13945 [Halosquirtibacter laminarini]|uniref:Uncharacterized protein n=1 Tax=Halosquirtibacter laminarini TaxID=3374600 RepID=A0AC61NDT4_9BACT|nr:hypothetical protein K4L44_13945 [Prolixibacteraceae bacterium]